MRISSGALVDGGGSMTTWLVAQPDNSDRASDSSVAMATTDADAEADAEADADANSGANADANADDEYAHADDDDAADDAADDADASERGDIGSRCAPRSGARQRA